MMASSILYSATAHYLSCAVYVIRTCDAMVELKEYPLNI